MGACVLADEAALTDEMRYWSGLGGAPLVRERKAGLLGSLKNLPGVTVYSAKPVVTTTFPTAFLMANDSIASAARSSG